MRLFAGNYPEGRTLSGLRWVSAFAHKATRWHMHLKSQGLSTKYLIWGAHNVRLCHLF